MGGAIERLQYNRYFNLAPRGSFSFNGAFTSIDGSTATSAGGLGFADFLLGIPGFTDRQVGDAQGYQRATTWSLYFNDDWKLTPRVTLNLGIRYEFNPPPTDKYDFMFNGLGVEPRQPVVFRPGSGDLTKGMISGQVIALRGMESNGIRFSRDGRYGRYPIPPDRNDFAPRFGVAWQPIDRWVIRTAYGIFYDKDFFNIYWDLVRNPPRVTRTQTTQDVLRPTVTLANAFPEAGGVPLFPIINAVSEGNRTPYIHQWQFDIEHELARDLVAEVAYIGNKGTKLSHIVILNNAPPGPGPVQSRRPNPQFGWLAPFMNEVNSIYQGLEVKVQKKFSRTFTFLSSYTFSKAIDTGARARQEGGGLEQDRAQNETFCRNPCERGLASFNPIHVYALNSVYELPFGKGRWGGSAPLAVRKVVEGWEISGIVSRRTGFPFSVLLSGDNSGTGGMRERADRLAGVPVSLPESQRTTAKWFNTQAFAMPQRYTFGNSGRNIVQGPGFSNIDFMLSKSTYLGEQSRLQFRAEFFNLFNHPNFATPRNTFNSADFGVLTVTANAARQIQLALKLVF